MEIDVPKFQAKTEVEIKNYGAIKTVLSKLYDAEIELFEILYIINKIKI